MGFSKFARMFSALGRVQTLAIELSDAKAMMQGDQDRLQIVRREMQDVSERCKSSEEACRQLKE